MKRPIIEQLYADGFAFDFFQAVRLLEKLDPAGAEVGGEQMPSTEVVRFRVHNSCAFPASSIQSIDHHVDEQDLPAVMTVNFFGLTGPTGILPRHYTDLILRTEKDRRDDERSGLRAFFDIFNHRLISLFYRAWKKYRFPINHDQSRRQHRNDDTFTSSIMCLVGMGTPSLRRRMRVEIRKPTVTIPEFHEAPEPEVSPNADVSDKSHVLAEINDYVIAYYSGLFSNFRRSSAGLSQLLSDYFALPVEVESFHGQWLRLEPKDLTRLSETCEHAVLGQSAVAGDRVWDIQSRVRLRIGPLDLPTFESLLPDRTPVPHRKSFFLLCHLARHYLGPEFDFDIQMVLRAKSVPACLLGRGDANDGPRLGWTTWIADKPFPRDAEDAIFEGVELFLVDR